MGLTNVPPTFQRLMELALTGVDWRQCLVYLHDICLFSPSFDNHILLLREVLSKLRDAHLKLEVVFLGHEVSASGVQPDPRNVAKIAQWAAPTTATNVRQFLGLASYYRKFCKDFAQVVFPSPVCRRRMYHLFGRWIATKHLYDCAHC